MKKIYLVNKNMRKTTLSQILALCFTFTCLPTIAQDVRVIDAQSQIKESLGVVSENDSFKYVKSFSLPKDLHIVQLNGDYLITSADGKFLFSGEYIDVADKQSIKSQIISEEVKAYLGSLTENDYVVYPSLAPNVLGSLWLFADLNCVYCKQFHSEISQINKSGYSVNLIPFVRGLKGNNDAKNYRNTLSVFSEKDPVKRRKLYDMALAGNDISGLVDITDEAVSIVANGYEGAMIAGSGGTPTLVNAFGNVLVGYVKAEVAEKFMTLAP